MSRKERHAAANDRREEYAVMFLRIMLNLSVGHAQLKRDECAKNNPQEKSLYVEGFNVALGRLNNIRTRTAASAVA